MTSTTDLFFKKINWLPILRGIAFYSLLALLLTIPMHSYSQATSYTLVDVRWGWNDPDWSSQRAVPLKLYTDFKPTAVTLDRFGGDATRTSTASGHFRTERINGRMMFVDPEGHPFISMGICTVKPLSSPDSADMEPFQRLFSGDVTRWAAQVSNQFNSAYINTLGCWSDWKTFKKIGKPKPYTIALEFLSGFATKIGMSYIPEGRQPIFNPNFSAYCDDLVRTQVLPYATDPYLIGVFTDNEIDFSIRTLDQLLSASQTDYGRIAAVKWLQQRYPNAANPSLVAITNSDRSAFLQYFAETYYRIAHEALQRQVPTVLDLSSRIDDEHASMEAIMRAAAKYCDVLAINWYGVFNPDPTILEKWGDWTGDKPLIVSEFYSKGSDVGFTNRGGMGLIVRTQEERATFYEHFALRLLRSANCIGWHWYCYNNTSKWQALQPFGSGNNAGHDSNKGIVDYEYQPYSPLADSMKLVNANVYGLERYFEVKNQALLSPPAGSWTQREKLNNSYLPSTKNWAFCYGDTLTTLSSSQISKVLSKVTGGFQIGHSRGLSLVRKAPLKGGARITCRIRLVAAGNGKPIQIVLHGGNANVGYAFSLGTTTAAPSSVSRNGTRIRGCGYLLPKNMTQTFDISATFFDGNGEARLIANNKSLVGFRDDSALKGTYQPGIGIILPPGAKLIVEEMIVLQAPI